MRRIELTPTGSVGLDFGTTNSAIAAIVDSQPVLAEFSSGSGTTDTFPSVLYFERRKEETRTRLTSAAGPEALRRYLDLKRKGGSFIAQAYSGMDFDGTGVFSQPTPREMTPNWATFGHLLSTNGSTRDIGVQAHSHASSVDCPHFFQRATPRRL